MAGEAIEEPEGAVASPFTIVGDTGAGVCEDGFCAVPGDGS
ncbi:hypothetical protein [Spirillospora sp. NPDC029432]